MTDFQLYQLPMKGAQTCKRGFQSLCKLMFLLVPHTRRVLKLQLQFVIAEQHQAPAT